MSRLRIFLQILWVACAALLGTCLSAMAQNPFSPALYVNNAIISHYEIDQRIRLLQALGANRPDIREFAIAQLTDDRLKMEQADTLGMTLPDESLGEAIEQYAQQRQLTLAGLRSRLSQTGADFATFEEFITTGVLWREIVRNRFSDRATPTESDIENVLNTAASSAQESVFLREIALPFAEHGQQGTRDLAERIARDVKAGSSFAALARQYSRTPSAPRGGSLDWTPVNRLPAPVASRVLALAPGQVASPLEVSAGILLYQLVDIREDSANRTNDVLASYVRLDIILPANPSENDMTAARARAQDMIDDIDTCLEAEGLASDFGEQSGRYGPEIIANIDDETASVLMNLDASEAGFSMVDTGIISVFVLCNRRVDAAPEQVDGLRTQILNQRLTRFADDYLQELLADAIIREN